MTDASDSGRRKNPDRRRSPRRAEEGAHATERRDLIVAGPRQEAPGAQSRPAARPVSAGTASASFAAQLLGQPGVKRGLKGGPEVIDGARSAYLETKFLGNERRLPKGVIARKDI
jgi:hypothetical protein